MTKFPFQLFKVGYINLYGSIVIHNIGKILTIIIFSPNSEKFIFLLHFFCFLGQRHCFFGGFSCPNIGVFLPQHWGFFCPQHWGGFLPQHWVFLPQHCFLTNIAFLTQDDYQKRICIIPLIAFKHFLTKVSAMKKQKLQ